MLLTICTFFFEVFGGFDLRVGVTLGIAVGSATLCTFSRLGAVCSTAGAVCFIFGVGATVYCTLVEVLAIFGRPSVGH